MASSIGPRCVIRRIPSAPGSVAAHSYLPSRWATSAANRQTHPAPVIGRFDDARAEIPQVAILIVEPFRHGAGEVISASARMNCQSGIS